jgi:hypothetical protein
MIPLDPLIAPAGADPGFYSVSRPQKVSLDRIGKNAAWVCGAVVRGLKRDKCGMPATGLLSLLSGWRTAAVLGSLLITSWLPGLAAAPRGDALAGNSSRDARYIGMEYEVWFPGIPTQGPYGGEHYWEPRWGTPLLGTYDSTDPKVIDKHAEWLAAIGVDFVLIDWANNIANALSGPTIVGDTIRERTNSVFQEYHRLQQRGAPHPRIAILLGAQNQNGVAAQDTISSGSLNREADYVHDHFISKNPDLYFQYKGKPLLVIYLGTPAALNPPPSWSDPRFTVRWMSGFLESQPGLYSGLPAKNQFWSWMDRSPTPAHADQNVEAVTVTQAYPGQESWLDTTHRPPPRPRVGRDGASTFSIQWRRAARYAPEIILLNQWNEFSNQDRSRPATGDEYTIELSNDLEPTQELGCQPIRAVQKAVSSWKKVNLAPINCVIP